MESPNFSGFVAEALIPASKDPLFKGHFCVGSVGGDGGPWHVFSSYKHIRQVDEYVNIYIYTHIESPISVNIKFCSSEY